MIEQGRECKDIVTQLAHGFVNCMTPLNMTMLVVGIVVGLPVQHPANETLHSGSRMAGVGGNQSFKLAGAIGHLINQPDSQRLVSIKQHAGIEHPLGLSGTDQIDQQLGIVQRIDQSQLGRRDPQPRPRRGHANICR